MSKALDPQVQAPNEELSSLKFGKVFEALKGAYEVGQEVATYLRYEKHPFFVQLNNMTKVPLFVKVDLSGAIKNRRKVELITLPPIIPPETTQTISFERDEHDEGQRSSFVLWLGTGHPYLPQAESLLRAEFSFSVKEDRADEEGHWRVAYQYLGSNYLQTHHKLTGSIEMVYPSALAYISPRNNLGEAVPLAAMSMSTIYKGARSQITILPTQ